MYFMGDTYSINTHSNTISLTTDLLVLKNSIAYVDDDDTLTETGNHIYLYPYTTTADDILLFAVNDIQIGGVPVFEKKQFYRIPEYTDLTTVTASQASGWKCKDASGDHVNGTTIIGGKIDFADSVKMLFRNGTYPKANLDIAYATAEQLSSVVSGETIGWTNAGILDGSTFISGNNSKYVVCMYINEMVATPAECRANRVLIATEANAQGARWLNVPANLKVYTRYLSVDADVVQQGANNVEFRLFNLAQDPIYSVELDELLDDLNIDQFHSKTLQMDYERNTRIVSPSQTEISTHKAQICRYEDPKDRNGNQLGVNLFANPQTEMLMVNYTPDEISRMLYGVVASSKIVERYVSVFSQDNTPTTITSLAGGVKLEIDANYITFGANVEQVYFIALDADIIIDSQESGYTSNDYLYFFTHHSAEAYSGTILYVQNDLKITIDIPLSSRWDKEYELEKGFYYIPSGGTSLKTVAADYYENGEDSIYWIDEDELSDYAVFVDKNGNISDAFVDTGLYDSNATLGGFKGGAVQ